MTEITVSENTGAVKNVKQGDGYAATRIYHELEVLKSGGWIRHYSLIKSGNIETTIVFPDKTTIRLLDAHRILFFLKSFRLGIEISDLRYREITNSFSQLKKL